MVDVSTPVLTHLAVSDAVVKKDSYSQMGLIVKVYVFSIVSTQCNDLLPPQPSVVIRYWRLQRMEV